jgi:hypothetical protein
MKTRIKKEISDEGNILILPQFSRHANFEHHV